MFYNAYLGTVKKSVDLQKKDNPFDVLNYLSGSLPKSGNLFLTTEEAVEMGLKPYYPDYDSYLYVGPKAAVLECLKKMGEDTAKYAIRMTEGRDYALLLIIEEYGETYLREAAEAEAFWTKIEAGIPDGQYVKYSGPGRSFTIYVSDGCLRLDCEDWGESCEEFFGKDEYEFHYSLTKENTLIYLATLRKAYGFEMPIEELFRNLFEKDRGTMKFREILDRNNIKFGFFSY